MRNPMLHPGDVRKLRAVHSPIISQSLVGTSGGVVFFSTRGSRSAANEVCQLISASMYLLDNSFVRWGEEISMATCISCCSRITPWWSISLRSYPSLTSRLLTLSLAAAISQTILHGTFLYVCIEIHKAS
jgi:hypothetical protein